MLPYFVYELMEFVFSFVAYRRLRQALLEHRLDYLYVRYNLFLSAGVWLKPRFGQPMLLEVNAPLMTSGKNTKVLRLTDLRAGRSVMPGAAPITYCQ